MSPQNNKIKAVVFDLGFTLINFDGNLQEIGRSSYKVLADGLIKRGCSLDRQAFSELFQKLMQLYYSQRDTDLLELPVYKIVNRALEELKIAELPKDIITEALHEMYLFTEGYWKLEDDTVETLTLLQKSGYQMGLISNASNAWDVNNLIDTHHLRSFFSVILISAQEGIRKPDKRIFFKAAKSLDCCFEEIAMVGDTLEADILGAKQCGMKTVWISRRVEQSRYMLRVRPELTPDAEIGELRELPHILERWNKITPPLF
jgi:HAD superfamily hydrolase (TIGR01662 family)